MTGILVFFLLPLLILPLRQRGWREAAIHAALIWGCGVVVVTEGLSVARAFSFGPVLALWVGATGLTVVLALRPGVSWAKPVLGSAAVRAIAAVLGGLLLLTLVTAAVAPPNTPDVLSYHLPRQLFWIQQAGVQHFETADARALMMPPWAEMVQANAMVLAGGDGWSNVPQWLAYGLGMIVASLLARELGAGRLGQWLAALFFATLPMAYLEASSAKNDLWVAVWLGVLTWLTLRSRERRSAGEWAALGAALGLSLATKTTAWIFVAPILVLLVRRPRRDARGWLILAVVAAGLAGPHGMRNQLWFGTPLGVHRAEDGGAQGNEDFSWRGVLSNAVRNATLHLATPSPAVNDGLKSAILKMHGWLGRDAQDPRTTLLAIPYEVTWMPRNEATAGAPLQAVLGCVALVGGLWRGRRGEARPALCWLALGGMVLTCVLLKWQPWGARLHLPIFIMLAALAAEQVERAGTWVGAAGGLLALAALGPSLQPDIRPLWSSPSIFASSRWDNLFRTHPEDRAGAEAGLAALELARVETLAVVVKHGFPYALMRRYVDANGGRNQLWVTRPGAPAVAPQGVVVVDRMGFAQPLYLQVKGCAGRFRAAGATDPFRVFLPEARARELELSLPVPPFVGWDQVAGLGRSASGRIGGAGITVRRMTEPVLRLDFPRSAPRMTVRLVAANVRPGRCELELRLDGRRIARVGFDGGAGLQAVAVPLVPAGERGELTVSAVSGEATGIVFSTLQILDRDY